MINELAKYKNPNTRKFSSKELVTQFNNANESLINDLIHNKLTPLFLELKTSKSLDADIVRAILWSLSDSHSPDIIKWLSGQEIAKFKADQLGLPSQTHSFNTVLQILNLISDYYSLIICFDELDSPAIDPDTGLTRAQIVSGLIKELFENLKKGIIVSVMLPNVWHDKIRKADIELSWHKMCDYGKLLDLKLMDIFKSFRKFACFKRCYFFKTPSSTRKSSTS